MSQQSKYKPGDDVFWIYGGDIIECIVMSPEEASPHFNNPMAVDNILKNRGDENPIFLKYKISPIPIGWMPENKIFPNTKAARILFKGRKNE